MKATLKPLSLAVAVASASYVGTINAQPTLAGNSGLGDLAIVPYYTVRAGWNTGVSVINTSASTQVVKIRMRRATDSMDAMDFNVVMSPNDTWTGFIKEEAGAISWVTGDSSCTVPDKAVLTMPSKFRLGADEGYLEILAMGRTVGWIAHWDEMIGDPDQKIGRPRQLYTGATRRDVPAQHGKSV